MDDDEFFSNSVESFEEHAEEWEQAKRQVMANAPRRPAVAAQSIDTQISQDYDKPFYPKDDFTKEKLTKICKENAKMQLLIGHLDDEALNDVINAFYQAEFPQGEDIIKQGDEGDCVYILDAGEAAVSIRRPGVDGSMPQGKGSKVATLGPGDLFGELAFLYNTRRFATVTATTKVATFVLNALDFKMLVATASQAQYAKYEGWLCQVDMLKFLNHYELAKLAEALQSECFNANDVIIQQGDPGEKFYILTSGTAGAVIAGEAGDIQVKTYEQVGDYFGEIALLTLEPRKATVKALGIGCSVVSLSKRHFDKILGPLADTLKNHADKYPQYAAFLTEK
jgi:cAMP-dependent protein kinase regulator